MTLKSAFFISPPYIVPRISTRRRLKEMPTKTGDGGSPAAPAPDPRPAAAPCRRLVGLQLAALRRP